jgi:hypothetical protein
MQKFESAKLIRKNKRTIPGYFREAFKVPTPPEKQVEGITLSIYLYVARRKKPVGPRDVMRGLQLSSPSVAYRHLEKLEDIQLLEKNSYGEYILREKAHLRGYIWVGSHIFPKFFVYSAIFFGILIIELAILAVHFTVENSTFKVFLALLSIITGSAMLVFLTEGWLQRKQLKENR